MKEIAGCWTSSAAQEAAAEVVVVEEEEMEAEEDFVDAIKSQLDVVGRYLVTFTDEGGSGRTDGWWIWVATLTRQASMLLLLSDKA